MQLNHFRLSYLSYLENTLVSDWVIKLCRLTISWWSDYGSTEYVNINRTEPRMIQLSDIWDLPACLSSYWLPRAISYPRLSCYQISNQPYYQEYPLIVFPVQLLTFWSVLARFPPSEVVPQPVTVHMVPSSYSAPALGNPIVPTWGPIVTAFSSSSRQISLKMLKES